MKCQVELLDVFSGISKRTNKPFTIVTVRTLEDGARDIKFFTDAKVDDAETGSEVELTLALEPDYQGNARVVLKGVEPV